MIYYVCETKVHKITHVTVDEIAIMFGGIRLFRCAFIMEYFPRYVNRFLENILIEGRVLIVV